MPAGQRARTLLKPFANIPALPLIVTTLIADVAQQKRHAKKRASTLGSQHSEPTNTESQTQYDVLPTSFGPEATEYEAFNSLGSDTAPSTSHYETIPIPDKAPDKSGYSVLPTSENVGAQAKSSPYQGFHSLSETQSVGSDYSDTTLSDAQSADSDYADTTLSDAQSESSGYNGLPSAGTTSPAEQRSHAIAAELASRYQQARSTDQSLEQLVVSDRMLGKGEFGEVMQGTYEGEPCAIKFQKITEATTAADRQTFKAEAELAVSISAGTSSPYVVRSFAEGTFNGEPVVVTELATEGSLKGYLKKGRLPAEQINACVWQMMQGVQALHQQNIVHRDIAARNFLVAADGTVKLSDFGRSHYMDEQGRYPNNENNGPIRWMSPTEMASRTSTKASDLWSLAVTINEVASGGQLPYASSGWTNIDIAQQLISGKLYPDTISADANPELHSIQQILYAPTFIEQNFDLSNYFTHEDRVRAILGVPEDQTVLDFMNTHEALSEHILERCSSRLADLPNHANTLSVAATPDSEPQQLNAVAAEYGTVPTSESQASSYSGLSTPVDTPASAEDDVSSYDSLPTPVDTPAPTEAESAYSSMPDVNPESLAGSRPRSASAPVGPTPEEAINTAKESGYSQLPTAEPERPVASEASTPEEVDRNPSVTYQLGDATNVQSTKAKDVQKALQTVLVSYGEPIKSNNTLIYQKDDHVLKINVKDHSVTLAGGDTFQTRETTQECPDEMTHAVLQAWKAVETLAKLSGRTEAPVQLQADTVFSQQLADLSHDAAKLSQATVTCSEPTVVRSKPEEDMAQQRAHHGKFRQMFESVKEAFTGHHKDDAEQKQSSGRRNTF